MSPQDIFDVVLTKRREHPALFRPPKWSDIRHILAQEGIDLLIAPLPRPAQLVQYGRQWTIIISSDVPPRRYVYYALHELGHLWLHHDPTAERWERVYTMDAEEPDNPYEDEVEVFVAMLLGRSDAFKHR